MPSIPQNRTKNQSAATRTRQLDPRILKALAAIGYTVAPSAVKGRVFPLAIVRAGGNHA